MRGRILCLVLGGGLRVCLLDEMMIVRRGVDLGELRIGGVGGRFVLSGLVSEVGC